MKLVMSWRMSGVILSASHVIPTVFGAIIELPLRGHSRADQETVGRMDLLPRVYPR